MTLPPHLESCPAPEVVMLFVEGKLPGALHQAVAEHVTTCSECVFVIGETRRFLQEQDDAAPEEELPPVTGKALPRWWLAVAAALAVAAGAAMWRQAVLRQPMRRMIAAAGFASTRPVEGRLSGFGYAPFREPRAATNGAEPAGGAELRTTARAVAEGEALRRGAVHLHARGVAVLLSGDARTAAALLHAAAASDPSNPEYWSDLAAARIAIAGKEGDDAQLSAAVSDADRALHLDGDFVPALFNRGVARHNLGQREAAIADLRRAALLEPRSAWAREAESLAVESR